VAKLHLKLCQIRPAGIWIDLGSRLIIEFERSIWRAETGTKGPIGPLVPLGLPARPNGLFETFPRAQIVAIYFLFTRSPATDATKIAIPTAGCPDPRLSIPSRGDALVSP
jgi:hypothetical protein